MLLYSHQEARVIFLASFNQRFTIGRPVSFVHFLRLNGTFYFQNEFN